MVKGIKEVSRYTVYDEAGNVLKAGFKDLEDAYEYAVNHILKTEASKIVIKGEITITAKK
ncbi:MAG: hypothetical protein QXH03_02890 [Candidatus Bathyarchaeia archaeon]